jgi:hypothetical protein
MKARSLLTTALAAGTLSAISFAAAPTAAMADNIVLNQWYTGHFTATPSPLFGSSDAGADIHGPVLQSPAFANATPAPGSTAGVGATWTITLSHSGTLTVTDVEDPGDRFELFDNGIAMSPAASPFGPAPQNPGQAAVGNATSVPGCISCETGVDDINFALGDSNYSSGTFHLNPGVNAITGQFIGSVSFGDFDFVAESSIPEPSTWVMMLLGFAGLGFAGYRKAKSGRAALPAV